VDRLTKKIKRTIKGDPAISEADVGREKYTLPRLTHDPGVRERVSRRLGADDVERVSKRNLKFRWA
jgi:hypothetical protein